MIESILLIVVIVITLINVCVIFTLLKFSSILSKYEELTKDIINDCNLCTSRTLNVVSAHFTELDKNVADLQNKVNGKD